MFDLLECTVSQIQSALTSRETSARELVMGYLERIDSYDRKGPGINSVISINPKVLEDADMLDAEFKANGARGPLHGVPVLVKDMIDAQGMPTTLGSVLFKDYYPDRDAYVVEEIRQAGGLILGKTTLGEMGAGDTHGSLFGSTKNPYALDRTPGGSSGGTAAAIAANLGAIGVGQEALASIRRPSAWTSSVGMRPTAGLVSRSGVFGGWPTTTGSLGPMTRSVADLATLLDVMVGYDPEDPITALGVGKAPRTYVDSLDTAGLRGARIGVLRESIGSGSEIQSEDFRRITTVFDQAMAEMQAAGAVLIDPLVIPNLHELLAKRAGRADESSWDIYFGRSAQMPYKSRQEMAASPDYEKVIRRRAMTSTATHYEYLLAREELMFNLLNVMAEHGLDAIVHKSVEHSPTLISEGVNPPYVSIKGATHLNTFLVYVPSISVPAGFTVEGLPVGISFLGRPFAEQTMIRLGYGFEQATHHRRPPDLEAKSAP